MKEYFISYAYGGVRHTHDSIVIGLNEINRQNIDESILEMKTHIMKIHADCHLTKDLIAIISWEDL